MQAGKLLKIGWKRGLLLYIAKVGGKKPFYVTQSFFSFKSGIHMSNLGTTSIVLSLIGALLSAKVNKSGILSFKSSNSTLFSIRL